MILSNELNKKYFQLAIKEALQGISNSEGAPFGACIVNNGGVLASAHDTVLKDKDATCHAEMNVIRKASKLLNHYQLVNCEIYCTSEPCPMCLAAIYWSGIKRCYFISDRSLAAFYGFDDQYLYDELSRPILQRDMKIVQNNELQDNVNTIFEKWKIAGLPVC